MTKHYCDRCEKEIGRLIGDPGRRLFITKHIFGYDEGVIKDVVDLCGDCLSLLAAFLEPVPVS